MGLFSFIGGILGGNSASKAAKKAAKIQAASAEKGIAELQRQFDLTRADFGPYKEMGVKGLAQLGDLVGINGGESQSAAIEALRASPFYQSLYRTGEEALLANASATGGLRGGNTQRSLADFGADTLMATIERQLSSLGGLAGMGMGATESVANFGQNKAQGVAGLYGKQGNAFASAALARGGINAQNWQNAGSLLESVISAFMPGGGGFKAFLGGGF